MTVSVNGEQREVPDGLTVAGLLAHLQIPAERAAVEHNGRVLPRPEWDRTPVQANDRFEIVQLVGGGQCDGQSRPDTDLPHV
jgi:sulfur carrier protein